MTSKTAKRPGTTLVIVGALVPIGVKRRAVAVAKRERRTLSQFVRLLIEERLDHEATKGAA